MERRLAVLVEGRALMVVVALEVRGEVSKVDLRGEAVACGRCLLEVGEEIRALLGATLSGSAESVLLAGCAVRQGSGASEAIEVALERDREVEAEERACKSDRMLLLLLALDGRDSAVDEMEDAEVVVLRLAELPLGGGGVGKGGQGADEVEDRKRNMMADYTKSSCGCVFQWY